MLPSTLTCTSLWIGRHFLSCSLFTSFSFPFHLCEGGRGRALQFLVAKCRYCFPQLYHTSAHITHIMCTPRLTYCDCALTIEVASSTIRLGLRKSIVRTANAGDTSMCSRVSRRLLLFLLPNTAKSFAQKPLSLFSASTNLRWRKPGKSTF